MRVIILQHWSENILFILAGGTRPNYPTAQCIILSPKRRQLAANLGHSGGTRWELSSNQTTPLQQRVPGGILQSLVEGRRTQEAVSSME